MADSKSRIVLLPSAQSPRVLSQSITSKASIAGYLSQEISHAAYHAPPRFKRPQPPQICLVHPRRTHAENVEARDNLDRVIFNRPHSRCGRTRHFSRALRASALCECSGEGMGGASRRQHLDSDAIATLSREESGSRRRWWWRNRWIGGLQDKEDTKGAEDDGGNTQDGLV